MIIPVGVRDLASRISHFQIVKKPVTRAYHFMATEIAQTLSAVPGVLEVYWRGGALDTVVFGVSDLDFTLIVEKNFNHRRLKPLLFSLKKKFAVLGECIIAEKAEWEAFLTLPTGLSPYLIRARRWQKEETSWAEISQSTQEPAPAGSQFAFAFSQYVLAMKHFHKGNQRHSHFHRVQANKSIRKGGAQDLNDFFFRLDQLAQRAIDGESSPSPCEMENAWLVRKEKFDSLLFSLQNARTAFPLPITDSMLNAYRLGWGSDNVVTRVREKDPGAKFSQAALHEKLVLGRVLIRGIEILSDAEAVKQRAEMRLCEDLLASH